MKKYILVLIGLLFVVCLKAQEATIVTKESERIAVKVFDITDNSVKYRLQSDADGPIQEMYSAKISRIEFKNGIIYKFSTDYQPQADGNSMLNTGNSVEKKEVDESSSKRTDRMKKNDKEWSENNPSEEETAKPSKEKSRNNDDDEDSSSKWTDRMKKNDKEWSENNPSEEETAKPSKEKPRNNDENDESSSKWTDFFKKKDKEQQSDENNSLDNNTISEEDGRAFLENFAQKTNSACPISMTQFITVIKVEYSDNEYRLHVAMKPELMGLDKEKMQTYYFKTINTALLKRLKYSSKDIQEKMDTFYNSIKSVKANCVIICTAGDNESKYDVNVY